MPWGDRRTPEAARREQQREVLQRLYRRWHGPCPWRHERGFRGRDGAFRRTGVQSAEKRRGAEGAGKLGTGLKGFDASCFDGVYVTGDINPEDISRINEARIGQEDPLEENTTRLAIPNPQEA